MVQGSVTLVRQESSVVQSAEVPSMDGARKFFVGLAWLFVLAVAIQFLLAGLGVLGGESIDAHRQWASSPSTSYRS